MLDEGAYRNNLPIGWHRRWNEMGMLQEELFYHTGERFDKRLYDEEGNLFYERRFIDREKVVEKKKEKGNWIEKVLHWSEKKRAFS